MTTTAAAYAGNLKQFKVEVGQAIAGGKNYGRTKMTTDTNAIVTALLTDTTTHPATMQAPPAALRRGNDKSPYTNRVIHAIDKGRAANLTPSDMHDALNTALGTVLAPVNVDIPHVFGTGVVGQTLSSTVGNWKNAPTSYTFAWQRAGVAISGGTTNEYVLVAADSGKQIGCIVTATNSAGSTPAPISNTILCA